MRGSIIAVSAAATLMASAVAAQGVPKEEQEASIPESAKPPEGMCRVWLKDVPERQQPSPTDCATALRTRPRGAAILWGDLSKEAKQPPKRLTPATGPVTRSLFDEPFGRRSAIQSFDVRGRMGNMSPAQAMQAAADAMQAAGAAKADQSKAAVVKRPDTPQH